MTELMTAWLGLNMGRNIGNNIGSIRHICNYTIQQIFAKMTDDSKKFANLSNKTRI